MRDCCIDTKKILYRERRYYYYLKSTIFTLLVCLFVSVSKQTEMSSKFGAHVLVKTAVYDCIARPCRAVLDCNNMDLCGL